VTQTAWVCVSSACEALHATRVEITHMNFAYATGTPSGSPLFTLKPREVYVVAKEFPDLVVDLLTATCDY